VFLSRGYGGSNRGPVVVELGRHRASEIGDEPLLLARAFPTVVARDRVAGAALAAEYEASILVLDDGFQNPDLEKDLSVLVVDGTYGIGNGAVFPAGPLRAPLDAQVERAQLVVQVGEGSAADAVLKRANAKGVPTLAARLVPDRRVAASLAGRKVLAFAGIGHPEKFFATLKGIGADVVDARPFPDHHHYSGREAKEILASAKARGLQPLTTEKDLARMQGDPSLDELAAAARTLPVQMEFADPDAMRNLLERALAKARR
jgi:tetraacyldisaccharide 4'-kinase